MTVEDLLAREEIRRTLAGYNLAGDRLRVDEVVNCFTADGVLEIPGARFSGRERIREFMSGRGPSTEGAARPRPTFVRHHITTCGIELTGPDTATARTYYAVYTDVGPDHCGYYVDAFRKEDGRWLIAERKARLDWRSPSSLMVAAPSA
ncbi:MAG TPA: nuclear transport factor 2 family protein [Phenylobacterium sp.]|uniref:nuclear transport factor 2 family protein n=1 Tax=Phenylobacterium sp. TaxID=1871053 RepID=UPI002B45BCB5|nr:nuclear transport factor 2 family protein [Phenylobacterium sp.]HKR87464.1 nuclear transport factor 2 family protein [Phenylobacterium sp.]HKT54147.1 nuclear transport factor 2 family protein [Caulobacteraceae bacterium]